MKGLWEDFTENISMPGPIGTVYDLVTYATGSEDVSLEEAITSANEMTEELNLAQKKTDLTLKFLKSSDPDLYAILSAQKDDSRGFFESTVVPSYLAIVEYFSDDPQMGVLPLIAIPALWAGVGTMTATALIIVALAYYREGSFAREKEQAIYDDPRISDSVKLKVRLRTSGSPLQILASLSNTVKWTAGIVVLGVVSYQGAKIVRGFLKWM